MSETTDSAAQWLRACSFVVADMDGNGIELAGPGQGATLRIRFTVSYMTSASPASMHARVYNLAPSTVQNIRNLATKSPPTLGGLPFASSARVVLKAGYQANFGQLFEGQIYQFRVGKESNVDSYMDIFAADGDAAHNWATMRVALTKGYTSQDVWSHAAQSMSPWQVTDGGPPTGLQSQPSPRGKVMFGMSRDYLSDMADGNNFTWNIYQGQLQALPRFSVRPGEAVVINSQTGQIGVPEQTENGMTVTCLLNPAITWGTRLKLNNTEIAQFTQSQPNSNRAVSPNVAYASQGAWIPPLNSDGDYVALYVEHMGDTRGNEWYTKITALSVDPTAAVPQAVANVDLPPPLASSAVQGPTPAPGS